MAKTRELLLAGSVLALAVGAMPVLAEPNVKLAQAQQQSEKDKDKAKQKGQPAKTQQPPAAKPATAPPSQQQPPAARTAPSQPSQQPAARTPPQQPSQQPAARTPPSQPSQQPAARTSPSQPSQSQPAARTQPPGGQTPSATQTPPGQQRGREQRPATVQQPGQPSTTQTQPSTQDKPGQQRPASREQAKPPTTQQPAQAPAAQPQPSTTLTHPSTTQPGQPGQRPAARDQRPTTTQQPGQAPTATQRPGQVPAAQDKPTTQPGQAPAQQAQPPASRQPPATGQQPTWQQQPAARTQPPAGQPSGGQPTVQDKLQPGMQPAPRQAVAPAPVGSQGQELRRVEDLRKERREVREGNRVVIREPDRMIIRENGRAIIRHNEADRFRRGGREVAVDRRGNEVMTIVERPDGTRIVTVVDNDGRLIRRARRTREGREIVIIDNRLAPRGSVSYFVDLPPPVVRIPRERYIVEADHASREDIYAALMAPPVERIERRYSLDEVRYSPALRERMPRVDVDTITFESGSWELGAEQIDQLAVIADGINQAITSNPAEVFLIEGHTDAVGTEEDNLSLSDRRAEAVAMALTEQFQVPAENLTTQGYGEQYLKIPTDGPERKNRRVSARRVTPLLNGDKSVGQAN